MKALTPNLIYDYILLAERNLPEGEKPTVFKLKTLTARERAEATDGLFLTGVLGQTPGTHRLRVLLYGLVGWENLTDKNGQPVAFKPGGGMDNLDCLPMDITAELSDAIKAGCTLDAVQEKNSASGPSPSA